MVNVRFAEHFQVLTMLNDFIWILNDIKMFLSFIYQAFEKANLL